MSRAINPNEQGKVNAFFQDWSAKTQQRIDEAASRGKRLTLRQALGIRPGKSLTTTGTALTGTNNVIGGMGQSYLYKQRKRLALGSEDIKQTLG